MLDGWVELQLLAGVRVELAGHDIREQLDRVAEVAVHGRTGGVAFFASSLAALSCALRSLTSSSLGRWRWLALSFVAAARGVWRWGLPVRTPAVPTTAHFLPPSTRPLHKEPKLANSGFVRNQSTV